MVFLMSDEFPQLLLEFSRFLLEYTDGYRLHIVSKTITEFVEIPDGIEIVDYHWFRLELITDRALVTTILEDVAKDFIILKDSFARRGE